MKRNASTINFSTPANWQIFKNANREARKAVAATRANHFKNLYDKLDTRQGERDLYRLAKSRNERTQGIEHFCCFYGKNGTLLTNRRAATDRWREYFEHISTEEFSYPPIPQALPTFGAVPPISAAEVGGALKEMKSGKATGPDDIASELWKAKKYIIDTAIKNGYNPETIEKLIGRKVKRHNRYAYKTIFSQQK